MYKWEVFDWAVAWGEMVKYGIQLTCHSLYLLSFGETKWRWKMKRTRPVLEIALTRTNFLNEENKNLPHSWDFMRFTFALKWFQPNEAVLKDWYNHIVSQKPKCVFGTNFLYSSLLPKQLQVKMNYSTRQNHQRILLWWTSTVKMCTKILKQVSRHHSVKVAQISSSGHKRINMWSQMLQ